MFRPKNPFSAQTTSLLGGWLSGGVEVNNFPYAIQKELSSYRPSSRESQRLYRCTPPLPLTPGLVSMQFFSQYTSWTYDLQVAKDFCQGTNNIIISSLIPPGQFLVDTTLIPPSVITRYLGGFPNEKEVIVQPGVYFVELV